MNGMIEFVTPCVRNYRLELFEKLAVKYPVKFIFTYGEVEELATAPKSWSYENIQVVNSRPLDIIKNAHSFTNWLRFTRALLRDKYEIIISSPAENAYNLLALIVSKLRFKKVIFWGESWYWPSNSIARKIYNIIFKWYLEHADAIIAMGEKQYGFYANTLNRKNGIFCAPKYVIPYEKRDATKLIEDLALADKRILDKKIILYMSQIIERKGLEYLIRAFRLVENRFNNVYLLIVGSGYFEEYCKKLSKELGIKNIMFKGYIQDSEVELYHNVCDVLVLPSIFLDDYPEPNGYVLYESMSVGKPLVVTDAVGATPEFVRDGVNGFVVKERNITEIADALSKILTDKEMQEKMSFESRRIFEEKISLERQFEAFKAAINFVQRN
jgi:glycosyltransferase involved in cell wall biosynthesis